VGQVGRDELEWRLLGECQVNADSFKRFERDVLIRYCCSEKYFLKNYARWLHSRKFYRKLCGHLRAGCALPGHDITAPPVPCSFRGGLVKVQRRHGPDFSSKHEFYFAIESDFGRFSGRAGACRRLRRSALAVPHEPIRYAGTAGAIQSQTSRGRRRNRLPLLSYFGGDILICGDSTDKNLHELPFRVVRRFRISGTSSRKLPHGSVDSVDQSAPSSRFRLFQSQHPHQQGCGMLHLPRRGESDALDVSSFSFAHGMVPGLPPESGEGTSAARAG